MGSVAGVSLMFGLALALAGCRGERRAASAVGKVGTPPQVFSYDVEKLEAGARNARLTWLLQLAKCCESTVSQVSDPALVRRVELAARASGARVLNVTVLALSGDGRGPVVTLASADPASYMKHDLKGFLEKIGYIGDPEDFGFVELLDKQGHFAWQAGRYPFGGGMVWSRPDLDQCGPIGHSQPFVPGWKPPPCPAD